MTRSTDGPNRRRTAAPHALAAASLALFLAACQGSPKAEIDRDPWAALEKITISPDWRARAVVAAWSRDRANPATRAAALERFEDWLWNPRAPEPIRFAIIETLSSDPDPAVREWIRVSTRRLIPVEPSANVVAYAGGVAAEQGWTEFTAPLVRSLAQRDRRTPDEERTEVRDLRTLNPGRSLSEITFAVFLDPGMADANLLERDLDLAQRARRDAWDLLARLDPDTTERRALIQSLPADTTDRVLGDLRAALNDLGVVPFNGRELEWLGQMRDDPGDGVWWDETAAAVAALPREKKGDLTLRHLEPIRFARAHRPAWFNASRDELYRLMEQRLSGRRVNLRTNDDVQPQGPNRELLRDWAERLGWADLLTLLVVDEAVSQRSVQQTVLGQVDADRADRTTEFGGAIFTRPDGSFEARPFIPRPSERLGDDQYIASDDMLRETAHALAHYHLHAQKTSQRSYAGPSRGDLAYAALMGRTALTFTCLTRTLLAVDAYQPDGVVLDLGEIEP